MRDVFEGSATVGRPQRGMCTMQRSLQGCRENGEFMSWGDLLQQGSAGTVLGSLSDRGVRAALKDERTDGNQLLPATACSALTSHSHPGRAAGHLYLS